MTTKNNLGLGRILFIAIAAFMTLAASAQTVRKTSSFQIKLNGTSNLHDWTMNASSGTIEANLNMASNVSYLAGIQSLTFTMPVKSLKSTEGSLMDSRAYDALKAEKYTTMTFKLLSATPASTTGNKTQFNVAGLLTIAGVTKQVHMSAVAVRNADGSIVISGNQKLKMTDFGIKPPSFMFGALRTGDNLSIDYTVRL